MTALGVVVGTAGVVLILVGLVGGGFTFSGTVMPTVGKSIRIVCFLIGAVMMLIGIAIAIPDPGNGPVKDGAETTENRAVEGTVQALPGHEVHIFSTPSLSSPIIGDLANGTRVTIQCTVQGDAVQRDDGYTTSLWNRVHGGYVNDGFIYTATNQPVAPSC